MYICLLMLHLVPELNYLNIGILNLLIHIIRLVACVRVTLNPGFDRIDVNNLIRGFALHFEKLSNITMFVFI